MAETLAARTSRVDWERTARRAFVGAFVVVVAMSAVTTIGNVSAIMGGDTSGIGADLNAYLGYTRSWMATGDWYAPAQLAGPYVVEQITGNVYPPTLLYLTVPFTALPAVLWWAVPFAVGTAAMVRLRPAWWAVLPLVLVLVYPRTWTVLLLGNPAMWVFAFMLAGLAWGWPSVLVLVKLTFAPLALVGLPRSRRAWFLALAVCIAVAVPFGALWGEFATVLGNTRSDRGLSYVLGEWPIAVALLVAGLSGSRQQALRREPLPRD